VLRDPVASTNIASMGYDEATQTLEIEFTNGTVYQYYNVNAALFEQFRTAGSKGQFLNAYIRNAYPYSRVA
jgi:hypothetical protein